MCKRSHRGAVEPRASLLPPWASGSSTSGGSARLSLVTSKILLLSSGRILGPSVPSPFPYLHAAEMKGSPAAGMNAHQQCWWNTASDSFFSSQGERANAALTTTNYTVAFPTFRETAGVRTPGVRWRSLALGKPPSWSWHLPCQVSITAQDT